MLYIGIDCGKNTGFAIWDKEKFAFISINTMPIHQALERVQHLHKNFTIKIMVEDARKATFGRSNDAFKAQGAGSVKRDAVIWEDFLTDLKIPFEMVKPKRSITKLNASVFKNTTGWQGRTSSHARDAAMLVYEKVN